MKLLSGGLIKGLHIHPFGPCPNPDEVAKALQDAMDKDGGFLTENRVACFLGQLLVECNEFKEFVEEDSGSAYEGRHDLGNVSPGDGPRYKGRGYIQLTGRHNYALAGQAIGQDLVNNPGLAAEPGVMAQTAIWFWNAHRCPWLADVLDVKEITHRINGGENELKERLEYTDMALKALKEP